MSVKIAGVTPNSLCANHGVVIGDKLLCINGHPINDYLDYQFYATERQVKLDFERGTGNYTLTFTKPRYENLGLVFETFLGSKHKGCKNKCIFCFIDQLPKGLRQSLYFKDDDERLSYLLSNYITLTNLTDAEAERICKMKLSPVNISVHTTNPLLRVQMLGNKQAGEALRYCKQFDEAGIAINFQIVLCPGVNDGDELTRTLLDLLAYENVQSIALVPVGLTAHRDGLPPLKGYTKQAAAAIIDLTAPIANQAFAQTGNHIVVLADEFYLLAERELPPAESYDDFPQLENGVGMLSLLTSEFAEALADAKGTPDPSIRRLIVTGEASYTTINRLVADFNRKFKTSHEVRAIKNHVFGGGVTVTGLLCGVDIIAQIGKTDGFYELLVCRDMLKKDTTLLLDDMDTAKMADKTGLPVADVANNGADFIAALLGHNSI